ncbi:hypothetical protein CHCC14596_3805 [Bacillus licheniformis]|nr:hypothetical protein CHCC14596_3805 [Bacillus licheniformis]
MSIWISDIRKTIGPEHGRIQIKAAGRIKDNVGLCAHAPFVRNDRKTIE